MALPDSWVDRLFAKLTVTYGQGFLRQYDGVELDDVKANWAEELGCFSQSPQAIKFGLEHLPAAKAPTVLEFRELCRKRPESNILKALPAPRQEVSPEMVAKVRDLIHKPDTTDPKHWARALKAREECRDKLTLFQRKCWREALGEAA